MTDTYQNDLELYFASMLQAKKMLSMGILTPEDYTKINTIIANKYSISSCSIYRGIDLIYKEKYGSMSTVKEVQNAEKHNKSTKSTTS